MPEWWASRLEHLQRVAKIPSPLFQAELERNIAAVIQQNLEPVSLVCDVYRSRLSTDVKDPLLRSQIPTEGRVWCGRGPMFQRPKPQQPEGHPLVHYQITSTQKLFHGRWRVAHPVG